MAEEVSISVHKATEVRVAELFAANAKQCYSFIYYYFFGGGGSSHIGKGSGVFLNCKVFHHYLSQC